MTTFKAEACKDIHRAFLNDTEFAEKVSIDGRTLLAVVERGDVEFRDTTDDRMNVVYDAVTLYLPREALNDGKYQPGLRVRFNGENWFVYSCDSEDMTTLRLYKERS